MKEQITKIQEEIDQITKELETISRQEIELLNKKQNLKRLRTNLDKEILELKSQEYDKENIQKLIKRGYESLGKTNGKNEYKIYAKCHDKHMYLLAYYTGIGAVLVGICPECNNEIDFTDSSKW